MSWQFDPEKYEEDRADSDPRPRDERMLQFFRAAFSGAYKPIDRGKMWAFCAKKCGMTVEELFFDMNRSNAAMGAAPFYGGDSEGLADFLSLQNEGDHKATERPR